MEVAPVGIWSLELLWSLVLGACCFPRRCVAFVLLLGSLLAPSLGLAADDWRPPPPTGNDGFDWIELKSGEWLKGRIKSLQEEKLEFDSEELNLFTFDWKDIRTVHSPRLNSVRVENRKPVDGTLVVTTNEVQVFTATETNTYPRADLLAITPTGNRELDKWSGKIYVGVSFRAGNTRETDVNAHSTLQRRTPDSRLYLDYLGNYGKVNGEKTEDNHLVTGQFDYFLSRRLYVRMPDVQYLRDPFQNLEHRLTVGAGVGYDIIKTSRTEWNITASPSWQRNWFDNVQTNQSSSAESAALVLETRFDTELTQRLDFIFKYRGQLTSKETGNTTHHAETTLEFEVHKRLKLDLSLVWDHITDPKTELNDVTPKSNDFRLITSLGIDF
jgi:putative salt-induced outer membrane protein YdiY